MDHRSRRLIGDHFDNRLRRFGEPFGYVCMNHQVPYYCSYCLRKSTNPNNKLYKCAGCEHSSYCNKECQRLAWKIHRNECRRLKGVFPNLPLTEILFLSRIIDKVIFLEQNGDKFGWEKHRKWSMLIGHEDDIRNDTNKYEHFEVIHTKMSSFRKEEMLEKDKFFTIYCKVSINSHSVHTNAGDEIGFAIDLGVSAYDHSCRPNCSLVFDGFHACLRALTPKTDVNDIRSSFISYIDVGCSRYFECECERCCDQSDDILTSIKCPNSDCNNPIVISEDSEAIEIICSKCKQLIGADHVRKCQEKMLALPIKFTLDSDPKYIEQELDEAFKLLHSKNIYITRLRVALLHITGSLEECLPSIQKNIFDNYRLCFPRADRHMAYQLLKMVKAHIERKEIEAATAYAYEAMSILEISLGLEHPYYLQILALWTYLEQRIPKSDDELIALINFKSNRPVDIQKIIFNNLKSQQ